MPRHRQRNATENKKYKFDCYEDIGIPMPQSHWGNVTDINLRNVTSGPASAFVDI